MWWGPLVAEHLQGPQVDNRPGARHAYMPFPNVTVKPLPPHALGHSMNESPS